jgi:glycosyltransferase involved in cell wall biosynthesis
VDPGVDVDAAFASAGRADAGARQPANARGGPREATRRATAPMFVGVVIPARDEARHAERAIAALKRAFDHPVLRRSELRAVVVDDSSTDTTAERAAAALGRRGEVVRVGLGSAGGARQAGFRVLCDASAGLEDDAVWLATTDADSVVPPDWLARQLRWWRAGADAVAGVVVPTSWDEQPPIVRRRYEAHMARLGSRFGHPHVYGANLGLSKAAYLGTGGVPPVPTGEDHALWRCIPRDAVALKVADVVVATSARREGRAPGGFSALLRSFGGADDHAD